MKNNKSKNIISVNRQNTPGAWDNYSAPEFYYVAVIFEDGKVRLETVPEGTEPDASPEVRSQYENLCAAKKAEREAEEAERQFNIPTKGKQIRIVRGRKHPIGTEGRVFWYGSNQYGTSCGVELIDGKRIFVASNNVIVTGKAE